MSEHTDDMDTPAETRGQPDREAIREPPQSYRGMLKYLGPSLAVAAVTVGSGELIATTALGARVGIVVLWFLIISLILKVGIQYQFSKYGLITNKTPHEIFDEIPGTIFGHSWAWWWMAIFWIGGVNVVYMGVFFGAGTMLYNILGQTIPLWIVLLIVLGITIYPALRGYDFVEKYATVIVGSLVVITIIVAALTFETQYALSTEEIVYGLSFNLPAGGFLAIIGAVGTTGIAANELVGYAAYVQETGYGTYAGPRDSDGWLDRMEGWVGVMKVDVLLSVIVIVITTVAFFIVGATIVAGVGDFPSGPQLAVYLATAYGNIFGPIGYWLLLIGGFFALYSTAFGETQLVAVVWPDWIHQTEWGSEYTTEQISKFAAIAMPILWYIGGYISGVITPLILLGGLFLSLTYIPEIITAAWTLRQERHEPEILRTKGIVKIGVWVSLIGSFALVAGVLILGVL
jgi:manganese transport protein